MDACFISGAFSEGVQTVWDSTSIKLWETCPRKYLYKMVYGFSSRETSVHLRFGALYATAVEHYHQHLADGASHDEAVFRVVKEAMLSTWDYEKNQPELFDHNAKNRGNLIRTIVWYFEYIRDDEQVQTVMLSNGRPAVELSFKLEMEPDLFISGHLDRLTTYAGARYVLDNKTTTSALDDRYFRQYNPDTQMSLYTLAGKIVFDQPVSGVIIDAAEIKVGFTRFQRGFTHRTPDELEEWWQHTSDRIKTAQDATAFLHAKEDDRKFPLNPSSCGNFMGCEFRAVCSSSPHFRNRILRDDFDRRVWDPTENR